MSGETGSATERRPVDLAEWEAVLGRFREQCRSQHVPTFEDVAALLRSFPAGEQADMLVNLVCEHLERSWERGPGWRIDDYVQHLGSEFSALTSLAAVPVDVVECEFLARHTTPGTADHPALGDYLRRFPARSDVAQCLERHYLGAQRYVLIRRQGQGGLGRVWMAYDCHLQRYVAIKEPNPAVADNARIVTRLAREARLTAVLDHPGIVAVHELHEPPGSLPFYVMRLVEGSTLRQHIRDYHQMRDAGRGRGKRRRLQWHQLLQSYLSVCEAVAYAHQQKALHRDLKTDNVVLGPFGETVVLDWGLAKRQDDREAVSGAVDGLGAGPRLPSAGETPADRSGATLDTSVAGTPQYMAREQALGRAEQRSDIFSLGAILYEILTGRPPYAPTADQDTQELMDRVQAGQFPRPRELASGVPRPLEAVCLKALAARPDDRYATATAIADDVQHFLADEPVSAQPDRLHHRAARFFRRHAPTSIASGCAVVLTLLVVAYVFYAWARTSDALADERAARASASDALADERAARASASDRQAAIQTLQRIQSTTHSDGWSEQAWQEVEKAAAIDREGLRDLTFATLSSMDARIAQHFEFAAATVAFDADGTRVLFGGYSDANHSASPARLWDGTHDVPQTSAQLGPGPVVFAADGSPWQFVAASWREYVIWDVARNEAVRTLEIPFEPKDQPEHDQLLPTMAVTPRGELFAASPIGPDGTASIAVWNTADGTLLRSFPTQAYALAFSPDAKWLAAGDEQGRVVIWSLATGEAVARLASEDVSVESLAFGRDPRTTGIDRLDGWLLAVGDASGTVTVWDLGRQIPRSYCRGSARQIYDVEFSPDGVTLASCGRMRVRLWDVASGRQLLEIEAGNEQLGLAFSPDGRRLAFTSAPVFGWSSRADIYHLEFGRGVQTLRGLSASIGRVRFSRDGRLLAALSNDWKVGIWDIATGKLARVLKVPEGVLDDNADMDISPDGQQLAFSTKCEAGLWSLATGQRERTWTLPPGLQDQIRFCPDGKLLLVRFETQEGTLLPASGAHPAEHPRVCRVRDLLAAEPTEPIAEITSFDWDIRSIHATADGSACCIVGFQREGNQLNRRLGVYNALDGQVLWEIASPDIYDDWVMTDAAGELVAFHRVKDQPELVDFRTGRPIRHIAPHGHLSAQGRYVGNTSGLWNGETGEEIFLLDSASSACKHCQFSPAGERFAWGTLDGSVFICDIPEVVRRLAAVGLGGD